LEPFGLDVWRYAIGLATNPESLAGFQNQEWKRPGFPRKWPGLLSLIVRSWALIAIGPGGRLRLIRVLWLGIFAA